MDSDYYKLRTEKIYAQAEVLREGGQFEINIAMWVNKKKKELDAEHEAYRTEANEEELNTVRDHAQRIAQSLKSVQLDYLNGFKGFKASVISAWKSLVNQLINQIVMSGLVKLLGMMLGGGVAGAAAGGATAAAPGFSFGLGAGYNSVSNNPWDTAGPTSDTVGSNMQLSAPSNNNANFSDAQVEKIVDAINQQTQKVTTINVDSVEIARATARGNMEEAEL
jgi:hypothetical protein